MRAARLAGGGDHRRADPARPGALRHPLRHLDQHHRPDLAQGAVAQGRGGGLQGLPAERRPDGRCDRRRDARTRRGRRRPPAGQALDRDAHDRLVATAGGRRLLRPRGPAAAAAPDREGDHPVADPGAGLPGAARRRSQPARGDDRGDDAGAGREIGRDLAGICRRTREEPGRRAGEGRPRRARLLQLAGHRGPGRREGRGPFRADPAVHPGAGQALLRHAQPRRRGGGHDPGGREGDGPHAR